MSTQRRVVIAGGSGFIGTSLAQQLGSLGMQVSVLSRSAPKTDSPATFVRWDARRTGAWVECLDGADAIVNLAGRSVDCIKTPDHRDQIIRSRVESTRAIGVACRLVPRPPSAWIQMSTAHIYGDPPDERCDETSALGLGLAPDVARAWETEFASSVLPNQRGIVLRTSFVVGRPNPGGAGALNKLALLARLGLGGRVGTGRQGISWIHEHDLGRVIERGVVDDAMQGTYVVSSPAPLSQVEFMRCLRRVAGGLGSMGVAIPSAPWMVRLGATLALRTDPELALYGRYVVPARLMSEGFEFRFGSLDAALAEIFAGR
ncbi:MAG: DUF1731 domain-containing protein [Phycisphaerales bacterium]|nr:DUF1731 domain-containing protein [Phycisphaerales bacterium]